MTLAKSNLHPHYQISKGSMKDIVFGKMKRQEDITGAENGDVPTGSAYKVTCS